MKGSWITIICVMLLGANAVYGYFQYREVEDSRVLLSDLREQYNSELFNLALQGEDRKQEITFNGKGVDMNQTVTDMDNKSVKLSEVIRSPRLILRFSELNCDACIDAQIRNLNRISDSIGVSQVALFVTYRDSKYIKRFMETHQLKHAVFRLNDELAATLENIEMPYYFVLSPAEGRVQCMFIPHKEIPALTKEYLVQIKHKFFD